MPRMNARSQPRPVPPEAGRLMQEAVSAHQRRDETRALRSYGELTRRFPDFADAWHFYGLLLFERGEAEQALECLRRAQALQPDNPTFLLNFGHVLQELGYFTHAVACLEQARKQRPGDPNGVLLHAQALVAVERGGEAVRDLERLPRGHGGSDWQLRMLLGECRDQGGDRAGAVSAYEEAVRLAPAGETAPLVKKADAAMKSGDTDGARDGFEAALSRDDRCADAYLGLATLAAEAGDFARSESLAGEAIERDPRNYLAWSLLAARPQAGQDREFRDRLEHTARQASDDPESWPLHFARGRVLESLRDYDGAFAAYRHGNQLQSRRHPYSREQQEAYVRGFLEGTDAAFVRRASEIGVPDPGVIFICGMPRSGTTLVESILASHPSVAAGGEMRWVHDRLRQSLGMQGLPDTGRWLSNAGDESLRALARDWAGVLRERADGKPRITDKMPGNYHLAGLLHVCFPDSPIIYVHRDARDNGLSCFTTAFYEGHGFSHDLSDIGHFYSLHDRLMEHWRGTLGAERIVQVEYEALVAEPEAETRRLLQAVGLPWDPACLNFHEARRRVNTASVYQVRQPLYRSSIGRWEAFERHLEPLFLALSADPPV